MFEIEMKAHVLDRENVIEKLNSFAAYQCSIDKMDSYYRIPLAKEPEQHKSMRIRHEKVTRPEPSSESTEQFAKYAGNAMHTDANKIFQGNEIHGKANTTESYIFTYKQKKMIKQDDDGVSMEVNRELECTISNPEPIVKFLMDLGGERGIVKQKIVECYHFETECGTANIELCTVPPLGDFLEIEIVAEKNDADFVSKAKKIEEEIFLRCGIPLDQIEPRYYSEMLSHTTQ